MGKGRCQYMGRLQRRIFPMRAMLTTWVHDYLGYGYILGQVCHGHSGCVRCMDDTTYIQLPKKGSSKTIFTGHRRWLRKDDEWRTRSDLFYGTYEHRGPPHRRNGEEIFDLLDNWDESPLPGKKRKAPEPLCTVWKRKSIFGYCRTGNTLKHLTA